MAIEWGPHTKAAADKLAAAIKAYNPDGRKLEMPLRPNFGTCS